MTDLRKAAEMALDALRLYVTMYPQMDKGYMVDARETLRQALAQSEQEPVAHAVIAGVLFDFMGWLTSRQERLVLSSCDDASPAVKVIEEFAKMRGLSLDDAKVKDWQAHLAQPEQDAGKCGCGANLYIDENGKPCSKAQPEQEPVAWMLPDYGDVLSASEADGTGIYNIPLFTAPPKSEQKSISTNDHLCAMLRQVHDVLACTAPPMKRQWVGLTDDEVDLILWQGVFDAKDIRAIEAKLKEKNGAT